MIPYEAFKALPAAKRDAICAEKMGWELSDDRSTWCADGECLRGVDDWSPTADRNDAAMMVETACRARGYSFSPFDDIAKSENVLTPAEAILADPCLIAWAACAALEDA